MRLNIGLVHARGREGILKHAVRPPEPLIHVPVLDLGVAAHIAEPDSGILGLVFGQVLVDDGRIRLHGLERVENSRQVLIRHGD